MYLYNEVGILSCPPCRHTNESRVDCEYFYDYSGDNGYVKQITINRKTSDIFPAIIYYVRGLDTTKNYFCIEAKWDSPSDDIDIDIDIVSKIIHKYHYKIGFCIYNIRSDSVSMYILQNNPDTSKGKKHMYLTRKQRHFAITENTNTQVLLKSLKHTLLLEQNFRDDPTFGAE